MTVMASFTTPIPRHPGSACEEITFILRKTPVFFGLFHKFTIEALYYDYINTFDMSNGEEGIISSVHDIRKTFWNANVALDAFADMQYTYKLPHPKEK